MNQKGRNKCIILYISRERVLQKTENIEIKIILQQQCALFAQATTIYKQVTILL
jgi:hypothetical protein